MDINRISGAPDPTAGGNGDTDENVWHLDEDEAREQIREYLAQQNVSFYNANKHLGSMFSKVNSFTLHFMIICLAFYTYINKIFDNQFSIL